MKNEAVNIPPINQRIKEIVKFYNDNNVREFCRKIGLEAPQKVNRLFLVNEDNGKYPVPSTEIILTILNKFDKISAEWLLLGKGEMLRPEHGEQTSPAAAPSDLSSAMAEINRLTDKINAQSCELEDLRRLMTGQVSELIRQNSALIDLLSRK